MINNILSTATLISTLGLGQILGGGLPSENLLAKQKISLEQRHAVPFVNEVFKDNILLNIAYMQGSVSDPKAIDWDKVRGFSKYEFTLNPGETFAYHQDGLPELKIVKTTNAHFNAQEGFKFSGLLYGDGVCHFASLIKWVSEDAGLAVNAPTNHNFATIPQIEKEDGVSIYYNPGAALANAKQNLYVTNNKNKVVKFVFEYDQTDLSLSVAELN